MAGMQPRRGWDAAGVAGMQPRARRVSEALERRPRARCRNGCCSAGGASAARVASAVLTVRTLGVDAQQLSISRGTESLPEKHADWNSDSFLKQVIPGSRDHLMLENVFPSLITLTLKVENGFP